jgi:hypothetical protein
LNVHEKFIHDIGEIQTHKSKLSQAGNVVGTEIGVNYLFICGSFNDAVSFLGYIASND